MKPIVQCVPNISEGRNKEIIEAIVEPLKHQVGFKLISVESDQDYNRSVITLIGDPEAMIAPLMHFFSKAIQWIDMRNHHGEHPRMGAIDVVPFIPISNITMDSCIEYANRLGKLVSETFFIPVFMYAQAAKHPNRESLPSIRQGEFEGMKAKLTQNEWMPDYGTNQMHESFGVVAIGARMPLVAYNIDLDTKDEKVANTIAKAIRKSSGGFQFIQAGPVLLEARGHVQVTMNILDYVKNPLYRLLETVKMEAKRYHVNVTSSEVIGLIPKDALVGSVKYYDGCFNRSTSKQAPLEDIVEKAIHDLSLRDFDITKVIDYYL